MESSNTHVSQVLLIMFLSSSSVFGHMIMASEVGVVDVPNDDVMRKDRLNP
ncbi:hypothetical protein ACJX0J_007803, partial [Zea mays]